MADGIAGRVLAIARGRWFRPSFVALVVLGAFTYALAFSPDQAEVEHRLERKYGVTRVEWSANGRYQRDTLVVDGRDLSQECVVVGEQASLDDVAIECDSDVGLREVRR